MNAHLAGKKHEARTSGRGTSLFCQACGKNIISGEWDSHISGTTHRAAAARQQIPAKLVPEHITFGLVLDEVEKDKHGVTIEGDLDFGVVRETNARAGVLIIVTLKTVVPASKIELKGARLSSAFSFTVTVEGVGRAITQHQPVSLKVEFRGNHIGRYEDRLEVIFEDTALKKQFVISRPLRAIVGNPEDHEVLRPKAPYIPRSRTVRDVEKDIIGGVPPPSMEAVRYIAPLPRAIIPTELSSLLSNNLPLSETIKRMRRLYLPSSLNGNTYGRHFKHLIWAEEYKMNRDIERYDIHSATLSKYNAIYYLSVPGLAEKRPSVLVGDRILVQAAGTTTGRWFEGHAHVVRKEEVGLRFHSSFSGWSAQQKYTVHFKLNRIPMQRQHQALDAAFTQDRMHNPLIATNPPQIRAVQSIVSQPPGSVPLPGTGKTVTMVEASNRSGFQPNSQDSVCAPSNSAADLETIFRFYAPSRFKDQVPDDLLDYTIGHFSHIFIDEAGQANETEQLGPIIRSNVARNLGLEIATRAILISTGNLTISSSVVKLINNFRSHNAILKFPNDRFYGGDLRSCADVKIINNYIDSPYLPSKEFPIVFHSVSGKDDREASSPSFFNIDEITQVKSYVVALRADRKYRTIDQDIGIIAPYHAQCVKIRASLRAVADGVKVGSVEEFQGQERRVIIISTVRSSKEFVDYDVRHTLGFVANPRRFNGVLLIVVGDPQVLGLDPLWRSFLNYAYNNGGWKGPDIPWDPLEPVEETGYDSRALTLAGVEDEDANVDRPWRDVE
ncbi:AAA domain-containing protein [Infundibulicybe gibba]|nr:AAA domain-containing protein [Infundibulicybe gibba]